MRLQLSCATFSIQKGFIASLPKQLIEIVFMLALAIVFAFTAFVGDGQSLLSSMAVLLAAAFRVLPTAAGMLGTLATIRQAEPATREFIASSWRPAHRLRAWKC